MWMSIWKNPWKQKDVHASNYMKKTKFSYLKWSNKKLIFYFIVRWNPDKEEFNIFIHFIGMTWIELLIGLCRYLDQSTALILKKECVFIPIYLFLQ
jgi:hypothetical protein